MCELWLSRVFICGLMHIRYDTTRVHDLRRWVSFTISKDDKQGVGWHERLVMAFIILIKLLFHPFSRSMDQSCQDQQRIESSSPSYALYQKSSVLSSSSIVFINPFLPFPRLCLDHSQSLYSSLGVTSLVGNPPPLVSTLTNGSSAFCCSCLRWEAKVLPRCSSG